MLVRNGERRVSECRDGAGTDLAKHVWRGRCPMHKSTSVMTKSRVME
jgi:hypothetical protein